jgi:hypothetical protein
MTAIVDTHRVHYAEVGQRDGLARTRTAEDISTVAAVVFPVREGKGRTAAHANVRVDPLWRLKMTC